MKVWELIAELSKCKAGADVCVQRGADTYAAEVEQVNGDDDEEMVWIIGDGSKPDGDEPPL